MSRFHLLELFLGWKLAKLHPQSNRVHILFPQSRPNAVVGTVQLERCVVPTADIGISIAGRPLLFRFTPDFVFQFP